MKKIYLYLASSWLTMASLASCSSTHYAFTPSPSSYHATSTRTAIPPAPVAREATTPLVAAGVSPEQAPSSSPTPPVQERRRAAQAAFPPSSLGIAPRLIAAKATKQLMKPLTKHQEIAKRRGRGMSSAGRAGLVIAIGAVIILIGGLIGGANLVATLGGTIFLVGLIMLIIALIRGK